MNSSNNENNRSFDSLLHSLMGSLQLTPPYLNTNSYLSQALEDFLLLNDEEAYHEDESRTLLAKEESKLEKEIIQKIHSGEVEALKPNSGQAVNIGEHRICVGFQEQTDECRVWEWHGHILLFDEDKGYTSEYIYGNYSETLLAKLNVGREENQGRKELFDGAVGSRMLGRRVDSFHH